MSVLLSVLWILFSVLQSVQSQSFTSPVTNGAYLINAAVPVAVSFGTSTSVNASMVCGTKTSNYIMLTPAFSSSTLFPPANYTGQCTVNGKTQSSVSLTPVTINISGKLSITSPSTASPLTKYSAGSSLPVSWTYTPSSASPTTVNLTCASPGAGTSTLSLVTSSPASLTIITDSYGSNCTLSLVSSNPSYILLNPVFITVTQQLSLSSPTRGASYPLSTGTIPVLLIANPSTSLSTPVNVTLQCGTKIATFSVITASLSNYVIPSGYSGSCTLLPAPTYPAQNYLLPPSSSMPIYLKYNLTFSSITSSPLAGGPFSFQLSTTPSEIVLHTVGVSLICNGTAYQTWISAPVNTLYNITLSSNVPTGVPCALQTSAASGSFYEATSIPFTISANTIAITSPTSGAKLSSGSSSRVTWTTSATVPGTPYTASLACSGFGTVTSSTTSLTALIAIPTTYYGTSCTVSVAAPGFTTAQISVVVTQILSFNTPTTGSVIALTTSSIPVKFITSGSNIYANISVSFQCDGGSATTSDFAANTDLLTQSVLPSQFGLCSLTISSAPTYLVYSSPSVSFSLKYTLTFAILPAILYRGQTFTIQINTVTAASAPPPVTLNLFCPSPAGVLSGSWSGVVINQPNSLVLSSDTPLGSCYFNVSSDANYTQATSSDVSISKVPVSVSLPSGPGPFPKPLAVPLLVNTTVTPVNGTVNLQSTCSSLTAPFAVSIPINTLESFSYPQNAYGVCNLTVVDEVFEKLPTDIL